MADVRVLTDFGDESDVAPAMRDEGVDVVPRNTPQADVDDFGFLAEEGHTDDFDGDMGFDFDAVILDKVDEIEPSPREIKPEPEPATAPTGKVAIEPKANLFYRPRGG